MKLTFTLIRTYFLLVFLTGTLISQCDDHDSFKSLRERMVREQIIARGISSESVIQALLKVPRHCFVPEIYRLEAYNDYPLPIGFGQTISQPYIVAFMTEQCKPTHTDRVLEVGTGSGYQAAVLAEIVDSVFTIEIIPELAERSSKLLRQAGYNNVVVKTGDGYYGWPEKAPFDIIIVTAAPEKVPEPLIQQLNTGGRMIIPVGPEHSIQFLKLIEKQPTGVITRNLLPVRFVPLTGKH